MNGLLTQQAAPQQEPQQGPGDPETVRQLVDLAYNQHFEELKKIIMSGNEKSVIIDLPLVMNMLLKKIEQESGQPLDVNTALPSMVEVIVMLLDHMTKSVTNGPISMDTYTTVLKNTLSMYLKSHKDIIPPEMKQKLVSAAERVKKLKGKGKPSFLGGEKTPQEAPQEQAEEPVPEEVAA